MDLTPKDVTTTDTVSKMNINVMRVELFTSAVIYVTVSAADGKQIKSECMELTGANYLDWANDDKYLYNFAAQKMGYNLKPKTVSTDPVITDAV